MAYATSTVLAIASIASAVIGTGTTLYAQQQQQETTDRLAAHNNQLAQNEARNRELESQEAIRRERRRKRAHMARVRNQLAAGGTLTTTGTPLAILGETSARIELGIADAYRRSNMEAASLRAQGQMGLWEADQAATGTKLAMAGTAIKGASSAVSAYSGAAYQGSLPDFGLYS
jgi:uncharacterized protein HemX